MMAEIGSAFSYHRGDASARFPVPKASFEGFDTSSNVAIGDSLVAVGRAYKRMTERAEVEIDINVCERAGPECAAVNGGVYGVDGGSVHIDCRKGMLNRKQAIGRSVIDTALVDIRKGSGQLYTGVKQLDQQCAEHMQAVGQQMVSMWVEELSVEQTSAD